MSASHGSGSTKIILAAVGLLTLTGLGSAQSDELFVQTAAVQVLNKPLISFDISWVDRSLGRYFLADRSNAAIDVIDTATKKATQLKPLPSSGPQFAGAPTSGNDFAGPNGILTLNNGGTVQIWAGDGPTSSCTASVSVVNTVACSTVKVLDLSGTLLHNIPTGGQRRADELCFDPDDHLILVANDAEADVQNAPFVSFIPTEGPNAYSVVGKIFVPEATNGIEQCQWDPRKKKFYLNIPEVNGSGNDTSDGFVYVIEPHNMKVVRKLDIPVSQCAGPQGMAIGPAPQILLGCNANSNPPIISSITDCTGKQVGPVGAGPQNAAVIDEDSGKIIKVLGDLGGDDEVWFNPGDGHYFLAGGSHGSFLTLGTTVFNPGQSQQLGVVDSRGENADLTVSNVGSAGCTGRTVHSVAADPIANQAYLPVRATGGAPSSTLPGFTSSLCAFGIPPSQTAEIVAAEAQGCVAIFSPQNGDDQPVFVRRQSGAEE